MTMIPTAARTIEVPVHGMDCAECASHVRGAIAALPGVEAVDVLLSSEKAVIRCDPRRVGLRRQVISHTLMSVGVLAALAVGQWATAAVVVFFMRVGDYAEGFTTERSRRALRDLTALAPQTARVERDGAELVVPIGDVRVGETVVVRPGDLVPTDGEVVAGQATVDQAA